MQTNNDKESSDLAKQLLNEYRHIKIWLLEGNLGAGKTTFVKAFAKHLGENLAIKSPTYALVNEYAKFTHYDLYRVQELDEMSLEQLLDHANEDKYLLIEWPEPFIPFLNKKALHIKIEVLSETKRTFNVRLLEPGQQP